MIASDHMGVEWVAVIALSSVAVFLLGRYSVRSFRSQMRHVPVLLEDRSPSVSEIFRFFGYEHLPLPLQSTSKRFHDLAETLIGELPDSTELVVALRKLLEAKDASVRASLKNEE